MSWDLFIWFALAALILWALGSFFAWKDKKTMAVIFTFAGITVFFAFILSMWISLERPPMRTMGETRLWYSFFMPVAGIIVYSRWRYKWILTFSTIMAAVFILVNLLKPEIHSKAIMPALQSGWFAPHVIVYMFSYAIFGAATLMAIYMMCFKRDRTSAKDLNITDNLVYVGTAFLTFGMLFGALWAKQAWGTYWAWDPKETWAAITWLGYILYIHFRKARPQDWRTACIILFIAFVCLQMCWWGINYLPSAHMSIHTY